jgi:hypothetical protein
MIHVNENGQYHHCYDVMLLALSREVPKTEFKLMLATIDEDTV